MPSDFLTPFLELDDEFCKNFRSLDMTDGLPVSTQKQRVVGFQRRHSLCPVTLPNSKFNSGGCFESSSGGSGSSSSSSNSSSNGGESSLWPLASAVHQQQWNQQQQLPRNSLNQIPFRVDRSISMIEGHVGNLGNTSTDQPMLPPLPVSATGLMPPPGLSISTSSLSSPKSLTPTPTQTPTPPISTRYKTELCRTYEESGTCKYGAKCQFAHGMEELRGLNRHPKYKTEPCRTFHTIGFCPYGARCHFIHNADEMVMNNGVSAATAAGSVRPKLRERPQLLRQSVSFAGFSSQPLTGFQSLHEPLAFSRASSVSPPPSTDGSPDLLSPLFPEPRSLSLKQSYPPLPCAADLDSVSDHHHLSINNNSRANNFRMAESKFESSSGFLASKAAAVASVVVQNNLRNNNNAFTLTGLSALQRSTSADSLSDQEGYTSSSSLSGSESPSFEGKRLPIFSRLSVSDD